MHLRPWLCAVAGLAAGLAGWGCEGTSDRAATDTVGPAETDTGRSVDTPAVPADVADPLAACGCSNPLGSGYRFIELVALEPDDPNVTSDDGLLEALTNNWSQDIGDNLLNMVVEMTGYDAAARTLELTMGPAWPDGSGDFRLLEGRTVQIHAQLQGCQFASTETFSLDIYSGPADQPQLCGPALGHAIPVHEMALSGTIGDNCSLIADGHMIGCLTAAESRDVCFCMMENNACPREESDDPLYVEGQPSRNCGGCGGLPWVNQGYMVENALSDTYKDSTFCPTASAVPGYRFGGAYQAQRLTNYKSVSAAK